MYYVVAILLFLCASVDDLLDGHVYDIWAALLTILALVSGVVGPLQLWFALNFAVFGYFLYMEEVWGLADVLLFASGSLYLQSFSMVVVYLSTVLVGGTVYSFVWDKYLQKKCSVRFVPVLAVAFLSAVLVI